jgi:pSer/pThr/pTyr-binding forkhead associated (FHA) protein
VGRPGADVAIDDDRFLAQEHARIERSPEGALVTPLDRTNGVFRRVDQSVELSDGDVILAGREVLRFELVGEEERDAAPLVRHGVTLFGSPPREPWGRLLQLLPSGGVRDVRHLDGDEVTLGREEGDVVFRDDKFLSRVHAVLRFSGGRCRLEDLKSSNGTFLRLRAPTRIAPGDHLRMGDQLFRFELR